MVPGEIGTAIRVGKRSENTGFWHKNDPENYTNSARHHPGIDKMPD